MNNSVDGFFREKLESHSVAPDTNAWSRIGSGLSKKNKTIVWFRAAAALALIAMGTWLFLTINTSTEKPEVVAEVNAKETFQQNQEQSIPRPAVAIEEKKSQQVAQAAPLQKAKPEIKAENGEEELLLLDLTEELSVSVNILNTETPEVTVVVAEEKREPIVIVYELAEIVKRKPDIILEDFPERKNGLKKVWEIASDMRNGDSPIVGLRQAKEEILALNFKKDDKKNNSR